MKRKKIVRRLAKRHTSICSFELDAIQRENNDEAKVWMARRFELRATARYCFGIEPKEIEEASGFLLDQIHFSERTQKKLRQG